MGSFLIWILQTHFVASIGRIKRGMTFVTQTLGGLDITAALMTDSYEVCDAWNLVGMHPELMCAGTSDNGLGCEFANLSFAFDDLVTASRSVRHGVITDKPWPHGDLRGHATEWFKESLTCLTVVITRRLKVPTVGTKDGAGMC